MKEYEVLIYYKACAKYKVLANNKTEAHRAAYSQFMDESPNSILSKSIVDDMNGETLIESVIEGDDGSDMIYD